MSLFREFSWRPNGKILVFVALFLPLTVSLGFWQLQRADEKRDILDAQAARMAESPLVNSSWSRDPENHLRRVRLDVRFDPRRYLLLANRSRDGQVGYEVLGIARTVEGEGPILVNLGWVPASLNRDELPDVTPPGGDQNIRGYYYCPQANRMIEQSLEFTGDWPAILYDLDDDALTALFSEEAPPACEVRLELGSPLGYRLGWEIVNQSVAKHIGYAVQWFLMAVALIILALFANSNLGDLIRRGKPSA